MTTVPVLVPASRTFSWLPYALVAWGLGYGGLRLAWAVGDRPEFPPMGDDLTVFSGWGVVWLAAAAVALAILQRVGAGPRRLRWVTVGLGWATGATLVAAPCLVVLDIVALLFPGIGIPSTLGSLASRAGCLAGGLLMIGSTVTAQRRLREACARCGRSDRTTEQTRTPPWAYAAAYIAVAGCVLRETAQAIVGFGPEGNPYAGQSLLAGLAFVVALTLAGTVLPLALVHRWGRIWPRWVLGLAGRRVPRWLVLGPAILVGGGMTFYFGTGFVQMLLSPPTTASAGSLGTTFFWVAVPSYLIWGIGVGIAAVSYYRMTRPHCRTCGR